MNSLEDILNEKAKANALLSNNKNKQAEEAYKVILDNIENILKNEKVEIKK